VKLLSLQQGPRKGWRNCSEASFITAQHQQWPRQFFYLCAMCDEGEDVIRMMTV